MFSVVRESLVLVTPSWSEVEVPKISSTFNSNPSRCYFFCKCLRHSCVFSNELILCVILLCCHYSFACKFEQYTKSLQSCLTLCDPIDGSPPGLPVPGILQARTLEWVAISFSNAWKWKVKVKSLSHVRPSLTPWTAAFQAPPSMGFSRQEYWSGVPLPSPFEHYAIPKIRYHAFFFFVFVMPSISYIT